MAGWGSRWAGRTDRNYHRRLAGHCDRRARIDRSHACAGGFNDSPRATLVSMGDASITPNDYWFSSQWAHTVGRAPGAWELTRGIATIGIGIIDSGFDVGHPDAPVNLVLGTDYVSGGTVSADPNGHGTHVAGIIAAAFDNGIGVAGIAPGVTVYVDRILDETGSGADSDLVAAIFHQANDARIRVISLSLGGGTTGSTTDNAAIRYALDQGKIVVAATGNSGSAVLFPASYPGVIPVGAIGSTLAVTSYSNFGLSLQQYGVVAPGGDGSSSSTKIISTYTRTLTSGTGQAYGYKSISGTSMATPYVSGVVGLMLSINPNLTRDQVMSILRGSARVGTTSTLPDVRYGAGIVDASAAVGTVQALLSPVATMTATTTSTPTSTSTRTPTSTATSTSTATRAGTVALIQTNEETTTPSVTATATITATASSTATAVQTSTPTATQTATPTSSAIASLTVSPSASASVTATRTATMTPSPSVIASITATPSPSPTSTVPATRTSTATSTAQATSISTPVVASSRRISFPLAPSVVRLP